ncbi:collagen alpha-1(I) chain-like [Sarcophilus harrisii]|uniref:collagen alpha-1(I) chain-like n=1 Tax=Sarcophilus harrisii TaxID=9305 RepID=UPI001301C708|nr:collagen alpha-1(I) chain-like [Sarcophilus harrisii]
MLPEARAAPGGQGRSRKPGTLPEARDAGRLGTLPETRAAPGGQGRSRRLGTLPEARAAPGGQGRSRRPGTLPETRDAPGGQGRSRRPGPLPEARDTPRNWAFQGPGRPQAGALPGGAPEGEMGRAVRETRRTRLPLPQPPEGSRAARAERGALAPPPGFAGKRASARGVPRLQAPALSHPDLCSPENGVTEWVALGPPVTLAGSTPKGVRTEGGAGAGRGRSRPSPPPPPPPTREARTPALRRAWCPARPSGAPHWELPRPWGIFFIPQTRPLPRSLWAPLPRPPGLPPLLSGPPGGAELPPPPLPRSRLRAPARTPGLRPGRRRVPVSPRVREPSLGRPSRSRGGAPAARLQRDTAGLRTAGGSPIRRRGPGGSSGVPGTAGVPPGAASSGLKQESTATYRPGRERAPGSLRSAPGGNGRCCASEPDSGLRTAPRGPGPAWTCSQKHWGPGPARRPALCAACGQRREKRPSASSLLSLSRGGPARPGCARRPARTEA